MFKFLSRNKEKGILLLLVIAILIAFGFLSTINMLLALVLLFGSTVFFWFWYDIRLGLVVTLFSVLLGQIFRLNLGTGGVLVSDVFMGVLAVVWIIYFFAQKKKVTWNIVLVSLASFLLVSFLTNIRAMTDITVGNINTMWLYWIRMFLYSLFLPITWSVVSWDDDKKKYYNWLLMLGILFLGIGFIQFVFFPDIIFLAQYGWDPHIGRLLGTFLDPNFAGALLVFFFGISFAFYFKYTNWSGPKIGWAALSLMIALAIVLTYSRSAYVAFGVVFLILSFWKDKRILLFGLIAGSMMLLGDPRVMERVEGIFKVDVTAQKRIQSWENNLTIVEDNVLYGIGYNNLLDENMRRGFVRDARLHSGAGSDSSYLTVWSTMGLVGLLSYVIFWIFAIVVSLSIYWDKNKNELQRWLSLGVAMGIVGVMIHAQFTNSLLYNHIYMVVLFALAISMVDIQKMVNKK